MARSSTRTLRTCNEEPGVIVSPSTTVGSVTEARFGMESQKELFSDGVDMISLLPLAHHLLLFRRRRPDTCLRDRCGFA
jgi:hypothetical protein